MTSRPSRGMQALRLAAKPFKKVADTVRRKRKTTLARFNGEGGTAIQECFLSVPPGAVAGEDFVAEISPDECAIVTLPHGVGPGDLLQVKVCYSGQDTHLEVLQHIQRPTLHNHNHRKLRTISSVAGCCAMLAVTIAILVPNWVAVSDGANQEHVGLLAIQREGFTQTWSYIAKQCQAACLEDLPPDQLQYHQQRCRRDFRLRSLAWSSFLGLLLAMSVQIWAVLSVTAMRFWHAVALGLLSMTLHGWAVAHFLLEVGRVFPSYTLRWSMWFDVAGFAFQLTALLLVLVLRMRAQQSSRLLGLDFHFLEDVMLLREAQEEQYEWDETDPGAGCPLLWRTYGFTPAGLFSTYKDRRFGWLRASFLYMLSLPSHFLKTFDWNGIRRIWYGPKSEEDGVRRFGVTSMVVINYMLYRRSNIIMTVVFLGLFIAWSLEDFRSQSSAEELEKAVDLTSYEKFVMDKHATGENATFLSYSEEVMMQTFSAIQLQSAGLTTWKAIIKMLFLFMSMAYGFFAMKRWNYLRTSQYNLYFAWAAIITFPFLITFVPTSNLLDWTLSEKIFAHHLEEARRHFHTDEIVAACMLNDPVETLEVARPVIQAVCPVLQQRVPYIMPGVVRVTVLGKAVPVTISSWLPWLTNMVPEGTNLKPVHQICEKALVVTDSNLTADLAATASDVCKSLGTFLYKNVPAKATTALTELKEALREKQQESTEQAAYQLHFVDKVAGFDEVPLRLFSQTWDSRLDGILVRAGGDGTGCSLFSVPPSVQAEEAVVVVGPKERGSCSVRHILHLADKVGVRAVLVLDPKRVVSRVPSPPRVTVGVVASVLDSQAILHLLEKPETHSGIHVDIRYSPVFGLQASARTPAGCLCKGMGYDSDCRVRPAELLKTSSAGRSPYPWCETAIFDYWGVPCKEDFDLCLPPGEAEAFEKPDDKCTTPCGRDGKHKYDMCRMRGMLFRSEQRCVAALGVTGKVERPDREPEKFEGSMLNFAGAMNKLSVSGRLLTLSPAFDCNFRVTVEWPTSGQLPLGIDGHIRYTPTTETIGDWSSARVNEPFVHEDEEITELHFQLEVKGDAMQFDAVRLEQQCRAHVSGSGQFSDWSLVPHGQLRTPTFTETGSNRGARTSRRLKVSSPSQDSDDDSSDDDTDGARVKLSTCSEFVGVPCIDPATNVQTRCSDNQVCDSNYTAGGGFCRCADGFCWSYTKQACVDQSEHAREVVSKLLDETLLERHSPKLWATAKEVATVGFCAMEAAESLNNILRHVLAIGPGILISAWTAKLIFVQSTIPGYFSYFFTMVYSPAAWVLNNVWHQTASDWRLSLGLAAMAFWTIPVSVVGMKYGLHRPMSVPRAMSLVNNLLLLYYFVLFAAVVFIVMFVFSDEPETEAYFSVSAAFRRKLRPGKLSKTELLYVLTGFLTESFAVFFITCCAATDAFIMVIVKEHQAAWSLLTRGKPLQAVQADDEHTLYAIEEQVTRDWLLLMKESSEEDAGLAGPTLNTRLLRDNERSSEPEEAVELTDMVRTRGQEMEEPSV